MSCFRRGIDRVGIGRWGVACLLGWGLASSALAQPGAGFDHVSPRSATVIDTPSAATEPLSTMYSIRCSGGSMRSRRSVGRSVTARNVPTPSTWPCTMCPLSIVVGVTAGSRFTLFPAARSPRVVIRSVWRMTSNRSSPSRWPGSVTVRQQPLTAIESPAAGWSDQPAESTYRVDPNSHGSQAVTTPSCSTIPLNMMASA